MNRPGDPVLAKFRSLRPAEKALLSLIYILSAMTKCGPKLLFLGPIGWGTVPHWIGPKKSSFGPNFDIGEFYDRGGPCTRGPAYHSSASWTEKSLVTPAAYRIISNLHVHVLPNRSTL